MNGVEILMLGIVMIIGTGVLIKVCFSGVVLDKDLEELLREIPCPYCKQVTDIDFIREYGVYRIVKHRHCPNCGCEAIPLNVEEGMLVVTQLHGGKVKGKVITIETEDKKTLTNSEGAEELTKEVQCPECLSLTIIGLMKKDDNSGFEIVEARYCSVCNWKEDRDAKA